MGHGNAPMALADPHGMFGNTAQESVDLMYD
jgi:hypothetical protein